MDLPTLHSVIAARTRDDVRLSAEVAPLGGGTWLYSEPQPHLRGLVDLTTLGWTPWEIRPDGGLSVAATCTVAQLVAIPARPAWRAHPLFRQSAESLLQSFKVWNTATIGGNIATALAAGAMIGLAAALDAEVAIWTPDGGERRCPVAEFVIAQRATTIGHGEVIRSVEFPPHALTAATGFRRIALSPLGRVGVMVAGRRDASGQIVLSITGGTTRPAVLRFAAAPDADELREAVDAVPTWFTDAHGAADWRRAIGGDFAEAIRRELVAA